MSVTTEFGKPVSLFCQLVLPQNQASSNLVKLNKIAWYKNNILTGREQTPLDTVLPNINLTMDSPSDGGTYTCRLFLTLGLQREYDINGTVEVRSKYSIMVDADDNEILRITKIRGLSFIRT